MKRKCKILIRTMSESLSPAPGRSSLDVADRVEVALKGGCDVAGRVEPNRKLSFEERGVLAMSHDGKLSLEEPTRTISFEEQGVSTVSENGIMTAIDLIVVEETAFVN